jgi:hypothetical protein
MKNIEFREILMDFRSKTNIYYDKKSYYIWDDIKGQYKKGDDIDVMVKLTQATGIRIYDQYRKNQLLKNIRETGFNKLDYES